MDLTLLSHNFQLVHKIFFAKPLYRYNYCTASFGVPPPRVSCSPDTECEFSATIFSSFKKFSSLKIFCKTSVSEEQLHVDLCRATSSSIMFCWYKIRIFSYNFQLVHELFFEKPLYQENNRTSSLLIQRFSERCLSGFL